MSAVVIPIRDLRRDLQASVDLINLGSVMCDAGSQINSAGRHVMQLNEVPTEMMLRELEQLGSAITGMVRAFRQIEG